MEHRSVSAIVAEYIDKEPEIKRVLGSGYANHSRIAKKISCDLGIDKETAVKMAVLRYARSLERIGKEEDVKKAMKGMRIELKSNIAVLAFQPSWDISVKLKKLEKHVKREQGETLIIVESSSVIIIIIDQHNLKNVLEALGKSHLISTRKDLYAIVLVGSSKIQETPGILNYQTGLLADQGINIEEAISCYRDTIFIVSKEDAMNAFETVRRGIE